MGDNKNWWRIGGRYRNPNLSVDCKMSKQVYIHSKNLPYLKTMADNSVDSVVTDPPYGLKFMNKKWDYDIPSVEVWVEVLRILKPGGHILVACGTRTQHRMAVNIEDAGFDIRDVITWHYGSGFPKSLDISKAIDKAAGAEREKIENPLASKQTGQQAGKGLSGAKNSIDFIEPIAVTAAAKEWDGWGTALKPATELWTLARKPIDGTVAENVLQHGTGGINIDGCRVGTNGEKLSVGGFANLRRKGNSENAGYDRPFKKDTESFAKRAEENNRVANEKGGRFPANVIFSHHEDCVCLGVKKIKGNGTSKTFHDGYKSNQVTGFITGWSHPGNQHADENGQEEIEDWQCVDGCPIKELDEQSGMLKSGNKTGEYKGFGTTGIYGVGGYSEAPCYADKGGASRFFYVAKSSKSERNKGLEDFFWQKDNSEYGYKRISKEEYDLLPDEEKAIGNIHVTVKPIKLMQYLVRMITPTGGTVLDLYGGSGTTGIACNLEGFDCISIEMYKENVEISEARLAALEPAKPKNISTLFEPMT